MASVFVLLEAFNRKEAAALGFFPCATASFILRLRVFVYRGNKVRIKLSLERTNCMFDHR